MNFIMLENHSRFLNSSVLTKCISHQNKYFTCLQNGMPSYFSKPIYIYEMPECVIVFYVSITNLLKAITTSHFTYGSITAGR